MGVGLKGRDRVNDNVSLTPLCLNCNPGLHLPIFLAMSCGLFAKYGLKVELLSPPEASGLQSPERLAEGSSDFCLTAVTYFLLAQARTSGAFPARFGAVVYQRSPLTAIVLGGSDIVRPSDLPDRPVAWCASDLWPGAEFAAAMADRSLGAPRYLPIEKVGAVQALDAGSVDVLPRNANIVANVRTSGLDVRGIPLPTEVYSVGLAIADHVSVELAKRMATALSEALEEQRRAPAAGLAALSESSVEADLEVARAQWSALEPYIFGQVPAGSMTGDGWARTISWLCQAHGIRKPDPVNVYRKEMLIGEPASPHLGALPG